jgi:hypothetical protein
MEKFYKFAGEHPVLTVVLVLCLFDGLAWVIGAIMGGC